MTGFIMLIAAIALLIRAARNHRSIPLAILAAAFSIYYGVRAAGIAFSLDEPFPEYLFSATDLGSVLTRFGEMALLFALAVVFAHGLSGHIAGPLSTALPYVRNRVHTPTLVLVTVVFTATAGLIALSVLAGVGGLEQALTAAKADREGSGVIYRMPATVALVLSCGLFHRARKSAEFNSRMTASAAAVCIAASAASASIWGSRQFIVVAAAYLIGAPVLEAFRGARRGWMFKAVLVAIVIVGVGFGLRMYRDDALGQETAVTRAEGDTFRQVSIAVNGTLLDSSLLAVKDWPRRQDYRGGDDFVSGFWAAFPSMLRPESAQVIDSVGSKFHQVYEPESRNGWPIGAPTEWYINFGWFGVLLGGAVTGVAFRALTVASNRSREPELAIIATMILTIVVLPLGFSASSFNRYVAHALPLTLVLWLLASASRRDQVDEKPSITALKSGRA
jgi:hypothetical protein